MEFEDKTIVCVDCQAEFVHSATDQARYAERGFTSEPKRCRTCREKRKAEGASKPAPATRDSGGGEPSFGDRPRTRGPSRGGGRFGGGGGARSHSGPPRQSYPATCASCGSETTVPFEPKQGRPVYCLDCFRSQRGSGNR